MIGLEKVDCDHVSQEGKENALESPCAREITAFQKSQKRKSQAKLARRGILLE